MTRGGSARRAGYCSCGSVEARASGKACSGAGARRAAGAAALRLFSRRLPGASSRCTSPAWAGEHAAVSTRRVQNEARASKRASKRALVGFWASRLGCRRTAEAAAAAASASAATSARAIVVRRSRRASIMRRATAPAARGTSVWAWSDILPGSMDSIKAAAYSKFYGAVLRLCERISLLQTLAKKSACSRLA